MNVEAMTNNLGLWIICSVMVIVILVQKHPVLPPGTRRSKKKAANPEREGDPRHFRAAVITAIGPTISRRSCSCLSWL